MQKVQVNRPIQIKSDGKKRVLPVGEHELSIAEMSGWYMQGLLESGAVVMVGEAPTPPRKLNYETKKVILGEMQTPVQTVNAPPFIPPEPTKIAAEATNAEKSSKASGKLNKKG